MESHPDQRPRAAEPRTPTPVLVVGAAAFVVATLATPLALALYGFCYQPARPSRR